MATPTLRDVAAAAGVSRQVVSAVLAEGRHGGVRYSDATRERVLAAVLSTGYRRNRSAEQMRRGRQGAVALLTDNLNKLPPNTLEWLVAAATERGRLLVLERMLPTTADWAPRLLHEHYADGVLFCDEPTARQRADIGRLGLPQVVINSAAPAAGCIHYGLQDAMQDICGRLGAAGCRQLAFASHEGRSDHFSVSRRLHLLAAGLPHLPTPLHWRLPSQPAAARSAARELLAAHPQVDGILLNNDPLAPPLAQAAASLGRPWPDSLQLIGFDATPVAAAMDPPPPSYRIVAKTLADAATAALDRELAAPGSSPAITIPYVCEHAS